MVGVFRIYSAIHLLAAAVAWPTKGTFLTARVNASGGDVDAQERKFVDAKANATNVEIETQQLSVLQRVKVAVRAANVTEGEVHQCGGDFARARQRLAEARVAIQTAQEQVN